MVIIKCKCGCVLKTDEKAITDSKHHIRCPMCNQILNSLRDSLFDLHMAAKAVESEVYLIPDNADTNYTLTI